MVRDTNLSVVTKAIILVVWAVAAFVKATILTIHPPVGHYSVVWCGEMNPMAFIGATILVVRPSDLHHKRLY